MSALVPVLGDREGVAAFLVVERPDLLEASVEAQAAALGVGVGDVRGLWRDAEFRTWVDRLLTWRVLEPAVRVGQLRKLVDISLNGERDGDAIKAFDVLSRQAGLKVADKSEVEDRKRIEISIEHLPSGEGGFVPGNAFVAPGGRRAALGAVVEREVAGEVARASVGPFDAGEVTVAGGGRAEAWEE